MRKLVKFLGLTLLVLAIFVSGYFSHRIPILNSNKTQYSVDYWEEGGYGSNPTRYHHEVLDQAGYERILSNPYYHVRNVSVLKSK